MTHIRAFAVRLFLAVVAVSYALTGGAQAKAPSPNSTFGQALGVVVQPAPPPPFPIRLKDGTETSIDSFARGRVTLATFWATWCHVCAEELPRLGRLQRKMGSKKLAIAPISLDKGDAFSKINRFYRRRGVKGLPQILDVGEANANYAQVRMTPTTFVINKRGLVVGVVIGSTNWESADAQTYLTGLMSE